MAGCGRRRDGERQLRAVAGRREPERLRRGRDRPPCGASRSSVPAAPSRAAVTSTSTGRSAPGAKSRTSDRKPQRRPAGSRPAGRAGSPCRPRPARARRRSPASGRRPRRLVLDRKGRRILGAADQRAGSSTRNRPRCAPRAASRAGSSGVSAGSVCVDVAGRRLVRPAGRSAGRPSGP